MYFSKKSVAFLENLRYSSILGNPIIKRFVPKETLSKVTSVKGFNHLICLINDKIYIFAQNGRFLNKTEELITDKNIEYYSLVHLRANPDSDYEYFAVGFISNGAINLTTYNYKISDKSINMNYNWNITNSYQIKNNALNCHYMSYTTIIQIPVSNSQYHRHYTS